MDRGRMEGKRWAMGSTDWMGPMPEVNEHIASSSSSLDFDRVLIDYYSFLFFNKIDNFEEEDGWMNGLFLYQAEGDISRRNSADDDYINVYNHC